MVRPCVVKSRTFFDSLKVRFADLHHARKPQFGHSFAIGGVRTSAMVFAAIIKFSRSPVWGINRPVPIVLSLNWGDSQPSNLVQGRPMHFKMQDNSRSSAFRRHASPARATIFVRQVLKNNDFFQGLFLNFYMFASVHGVF